MVDLLFSDEHIFSLRNKELSTYTKSIFKETSGGTTALRMEGSYNLYDGNQDDFRYSNGMSILISSNMFPTVTVYLRRKCLDQAFRDVFVDCRVYLRHGSG